MKAPYRDALPVVGALFLLAACSDSDEGGQGRLSARAVNIVAEPPSLPAASNSLLSHRVVLVLESDAGFHGGECSPTSGAVTYSSPRTLVSTRAPAPIAVSVPAENFSRAGEAACSLSAIPLAQLRELRLDLYAPSGTGSEERETVQRFGQQEVLAAATDAGNGGTLELRASPQEVATASDLALPEAADLEVNERMLRESVRITNDVIESGSCALQEACVGGPGMRKLLRFDAVIENLGSGDLTLGPPAESPLAQFSACHEHYHLEDFMIYELRDSAGRLRMVGRKQGFCLQDSTPASSSTSSEQARFDCSFQGITSGWADVYEGSLDCQWLDITEIEPGSYRLRLTTNPTAKYIESDMSNNSVEISVEIP